MKKLLSVLMVGLTLGGLGCSGPYTKVASTTLSGVVLEYKFFTEGRRNSYIARLTNKKNDLHFCKIEFNDHYGAEVGALVTSGPIVGSKKPTGSSTLRRGAIIQISNTKNTNQTDRFLDYRGNHLLATTMPTQLILICNEGKEEWRLAH